MGIYLNPGNERFATMRRSRYVDKSELIAAINRTIDKKEKLSCVSRPRRFGKSIAAQMLCAYYDKSCDSSSLFDDLEIAGDASYRTYLNKYNVIYLDITQFISESVDKAGLVRYIREAVAAELAERYPGLKPEPSLSAMLVKAAEESGSKFIAIIDEWDAPIRDSALTTDVQREYLAFLRTLFKSSGTTDKIFAAAYMTGILPIKKDGSQSAISEFQEFNMLTPRALEPYVGFTETEVRKLCEEEAVDYDKMKQWYDGYAFQNTESVYNPNSVINAIRNKSFESYWKMSAANSLLPWISMDYDGLSKAVSELMGGVSIMVDTDDFQNDLVSFASKDDVLTLLIHFGYLSFDVRTGMAHIPNEEIRIEFARALRRTKHSETVRRVRESDQLIMDTVAMDEEAVAAQIERIHSEESTPLLYNNEQSLRSTVKLAYFAYKDYFIKFEELPSGTGYADLVYLPKQGMDMPALVIELKTNEAPEGAIAQIKSRNYPEAIKDCGADILLVGISYDKADKEKKHRCKIERLASQ